MNKFTYHIKKRIKERQYKKYIDNHRENVEKAFIEMVMCPDMQWIAWSYYHVDLYEQRVLTHDLSKYSKEEFDAYRKNFYPINEREKLLNRKDFNDAWEHHWKNNRHHWEARQNDECPDGHLTKEQMFDCLENVLDWMAMGYQFNDRPYQYYEKHKDEIKLPEAEKQFIEKVIYEGVDKQYIQGGF